MIPSQLCCIFTTIDCTIIHYVLSRAGCAATLLLCVFLQGGWNLQSQIRVPAGLSIHKFLMRSLNCWILKASGEAVVVLVEGQLNSNNPEDVFLTVMITLLVPSLEKGMSRYCKYTSYQGKEDYRCHNYLFRFVSVRTCLWWVIAEKCFCAGQTQLYRKENLLGYHCSHWTLTSLPSSAADVFFCAPGGKTRQENYSGDRDIAQNDSCTIPKHKVIVKRS